MDIVRIGMIGSGHMNQTYSHCIANYNTGAELIAVSGGTRAHNLASEYNMDAEFSVE